MKQASLPPDFAWHRQVVGGVPRDAYFLAIGGPHGLLVAIVERRVTTGWLTTVNRHLDYQEHRHAIAPSLETGQRWVNRWVFPRVERLRTQRTAYASDGWASRPATPPGAAN